ncbi:FAD-dependent oxidoreductase [Leptospira semungkisensis]|uniref:FAD-dependent oxidoreductase n=1 Tax=Leptospira semungkisensis TaxID=2484985 RepID=A0A4R9FM87_9LEPT|nr:FAD-dependent oxidoreductase [Leptospira semungkisensis]TGJ99472.1 FAD-dependent oxidoreductase [Leptospira semungkisensis]
MDPKKLCLLKKENFGPSSDLFTLAKSDQSPFEFVGGQYVILNVGMDMVENKPIKRAYSILSSDMHTDSFQICVKRLANGKASQILKDLEEGSEIDYSGPWGRFAGNPEWPSEGTTLLFATDTGITALLGLLQSKKFAARKDTIAFWLKTESEDFIPELKIHSFLDQSFLIEGVTIPSIGSSERVDISLSVLNKILNNHKTISNAFLSGDGEIIRAIQAELIRSSTPETRIGTEAFFNTGRVSSPGTMKV